MKSPESRPLPLADAAEVAFELGLLRAECVARARALTGRPPLDEAALEECARLDDALASAQRVLLGTLRRLQAARTRRRGRPA